jgi:hypothetical protein
MDKERVMSDSTQEMVSTKANEIRTQLRSGKLYGVSIDTSNADEVLVGAYYLGGTETPTCAYVKTGPGYNTPKPPAPKPEAIYRPLPRHGQPNLLSDPFDAFERQALLVGFYLGCICGCIVGFICGLLIG